MIIKLRKYNDIRELLIENRATGLQGHICYQDGGWSCLDGGGRDGGANRVQGHIQLASELGMRIGMHRTTAEQSEKH